MKLNEHCAMFESAEFQLLCDIHFEIIFQHSRGFSAEGVNFFRNCEATKTICDVSFVFLRSYLDLMNFS